MIVQQINLYQDRFRQKRVILSAVDMLVILLVVVGLLLASSYWYQLQLSDAQQQQQSGTNVGNVVVELATQCFVLICGHWLTP